MSKKVFGVLLLVALMFGFNYNVSAKEVYYTTANGIELSYDEYNFISEFYWDGFQDIMTADTYNYLVEQNAFGHKITKVTSKADKGTNASKYITISKTCPSNCVITLVNTWTASPTIRSYDVIGAYLSGVSYVSHNGTYVSSTAGTTNFYNLKTATNGMGNSVKLPNSGSNIVVSTTFTTTTGGTVYGSYQHATTNTTLATSKNYNFAIYGYGNVFDFYGSAVGVYDGMAGVSTSV